MPRTLAITAAFQRAQARRVTAAQLAVRSEWAKMRGARDLDKAWAKVGPRIAVIVATAQQAAATDGIAYIAHALAETDQTSPLAAEPEPRRFAGVAADGRPLDSMLYGGVVTTNTALGGSVSPSEAQAQGGRWLDMATWSAVSDAARGGSALGIVGRTHGNIGYIRQLSGASCSRCTILAGKWYGWNTGFERHPRCDCLHVPIAQADSAGYRVDPKAAAREGQITDLTKLQQQALADGADLTRLVNATRNMKITDLERIYANATSREQAIALLRRRGFFKPPKPGRHIVLAA